MGQRSAIATLALLLLGIVLSPLRAAAIPVLAACDTAFAPSATTRFERAGSVRCEPSIAPEYVYHEVLVGNEGIKSPHVTAGTGAVHAYDGSRTSRPARVSRRGANLRSRRQRDRRRGGGGTIRGGKLGQPSDAGASLC